MMGTEAQAGSGTTLPASVAGTPAAANGGTDPGSNGAAADPFAGLETGAREWVGTKGYKSVADLATAARNAESLIGRSVVLPDNNAKLEEWGKVWARLGRPEKPDGYELKLPEGVPEGMPYDAEFAKSFKAAAHAAGLPSKQAQALHDWWVGLAGKAFTDGQAAATKLQEEAKERAVAATDAMAKAYGGPPNSDAFAAGVNAAVRAVEGLDKLPGVGGIKKSLEDAGLLLPDGKGGHVIADATIAVALTHLGKTLFTEDSLATGSAAGVAGENPFATGNMTEQMKMIRSDPDKARKQIAILGKKPEDFGWK